MASKERLLKTLIDLIQIDSPSGEEDAIDAELSSRLLALECWRGRDNASNIIGKSVAGGLIAFLNDNSGDYNSMEIWWPRSRRVR